MYRSLHFESLTINTCNDWRYALRFTLLYGRSTQSYILEDIVLRLICKALNQATKSSLSADAVFASFQGTM